MVEEIELKLESSAAGIAALLAALPPGSGAAHEAVLAATYFDTEQHALRRAHLTLRIRREETGLVQTLKHSAAPGAGLFARCEWERPVVDMVPVAFPDTPLGPLLARSDAALVPLFEIDVQRTAVEIEQGAARIELALDRGEVRAAGRSAPLHELELELKHGEPAGLFALANRLGAQAPLRIGVLSKPERGYRLLREAESAVRAEPLRLRRGDTAEQAFLAIAGSCIRHYRLNEDLLLERVTPDAVHQARVALRRLRSAMTLFKTLAGDPRGTALNRRLRALAAVLGEVRDLDVLEARTAPGALRERLGEARRGAITRLKRALSGREARQLMLDLCEWLAIGEWRSAPARAEARAMPLREFVGPALSRLRRKVRRHGRHFGTLEPDQLHRLRKDGKRLRYAADQLGVLYLRGKAGKRRKRFSHALGEFQDALGGLNDHAAAATRLARLGLGETREAQELLGTWPHSRLLGEAIEARHDLLAREPFWR